MAAEVVVAVRTPQGKPVPDAVVTIDAPHSEPIRFPWAYQMAQRNKQFDPFVLIVPAGADVAFPNLDKVKHHVYSFSPSKTFELKLYGQDETRHVRFDRPGIVPLGCNIHDNMVGFIVVVDTPYAAKTDAVGEAALHGVPPGVYPMRIWRPYLRAPGNALTISVTVAKDGTTHATVTADVSTPPEPRRAY